jgi:hypothetical protein
LSKCDIASFAVPFALAIFWRKKPEFQRRLMLIASCGLLDAAFGRFPALPLVLSPTGVDALICLGVIRDLIVERRVHALHQCELGLGCMYSSPSARFSAFHTFQAFGNSEKPPRNNGLRGALAVE